MLDKMLLERFFSLKMIILKALKKYQHKIEKGKIIFESSLFCNLLRRENVCIPNNMFYYSPKPFCSQKLQNPKNDSKARNQVSNLGETRVLYRPSNFLAFLFCVVDHSALLTKKKPFSSISL